MDESPKCNYTRPIYKTRLVVNKDTVRIRLLNLNWQGCVCHSHNISFTKYDDDEDDDYSFMLCFSGNDVILLQPTESDRQIINRNLVTSTLS